MNSIRFLIPVAAGLFFQCRNADQLAFKQYQVRGEQLYLKHCSHCHQPKGKGLARLYPPLAPSDYLQMNFEKVVCGMKYGMQGEILVNGVMYNQRMPGVASLSDLEIAQLATYLYSLQSPDEKRITPKEIANVLNRCP